MDTTDGTPPAEALCRLLNTPEGKRSGGRPPGADPTPATGNTRVHPRAPLHVGLIDHLNACGRELADHTRAATRGPLRAKPADTADLYAWARQHTPAPAQQAALAAIEWRHALEHAEHLGDTETVRLAIRRDPCPSCGTWGLTWYPDTRRAVCLNRSCLTKGAPTTWTLRQLATAHVRTTPNRAAT